VYELGGRIVAVQPEEQMVVAMSAWVTSGLSEPGVSPGSGSPGSLAIPVGAGAPVGPGVKPIAGVSEAQGSSPGSPVSATVIEADGWGLDGVATCGAGSGEGLAESEPHPATRPATATTTTNRTSRPGRRRIPSESFMSTSPW
jgi:hypothetical protein